MSSYIMKRITVVGRLVSIATLLSLLSCMENNIMLLLSPVEGFSIIGVYRQQKPNDYFDGITKYQNRHDIRNSDRNIHFNRHNRRIGVLEAAARYGPPSDSSASGINDDNPWSINEKVSGSSNTTTTTTTSNNKNKSQWEIEMTRKKNNFQMLIEQIRSTKKQEHIPRLLGNNIELIMGLQGEEGTQVVTSILEEAKIQEGMKDGDDELLYSQTLQTIEMILSFAEDFVNQAQTMDEQNKKLLGKIIMAMREPNKDDMIASSTQQYGNNIPSREDTFDRIIEQEKSNFTPGFLRHVEGECDRIANAPKVTRESARLLEILRVIQTRVLEEIGKSMGEATLVLGQLMGYDDENELLGVLEAGLTVRGQDFAQEMANLTEEALEGFQKVPGGVDSDLIDRVTLIDQRLQKFLDDTNSFQ